MRNFKSIFHGHYSATVNRIASITSAIWSHPEAPYKLLAVLVEDGDSEIKMMLDSDECEELGMAFLMAAREMNPAAYVGVDARLN